MRDINGSIYGALQQENAQKQRLHDGGAYGCAGDHGNFGGPCGGRLIAYTRLARFEKNEANARTLFQTAQIALTRRDTAGELDDFRQKVLLNGQAGAHFDPAAQKADELNKNIYALYYDK